jgi:hypothetical protein
MDGIIRVKAISSALLMFHNLILLVYILCGSVCKVGVLYLFSHGSVHTCMVK